MHDKMLINQQIELTYVEKLAKICGMEDIFENFTLNILKINKLVQKIKLCEMREYGLKTIHVMCVYLLYKHPEGLTENELVKLTLEDKAAISRAVKSLKEKGYADYEQDRYSFAVKLTSDGKRLAEEVNAKAERAVGASSCNFTKDEREAFYGALTSIADNLESYYGSISEAGK